MSASLLPYSPINLISHSCTFITFLIILFFRVCYFLLTLSGPATSGTSAWHFKAIAYPSPVHTAQAVRSRVESAGMGQPKPLLPPSTLSHAGPCSQINEHSVFFRSNPVQSLMHSSSSCILGVKLWKKHVGMKSAKWQARKAWSRYQYEKSSCRNVLNVKPSMVFHEIQGL